MPAIPREPAGAVLVETGSRLDSTIAEGRATGERPLLGRVVAGCRVVRGDIIAAGHQVDWLRETDGLPSPACFGSKNPIMQP